jgi:predicted nucleic acid-binding protein
MTDRVFVDTNVLLYARDPSEGHKHVTALQWLDRLWDDGNGRTSVQVLNEFYDAATRRLPRPLSSDEAWDDVVALLAWQPQSIDERLLHSARANGQRFKLSWWDSLIVAAAQAQQCPILLTEDLQHGMTMSGVRVQSPFVGVVNEGISLRPRSRPRPSRMGA